MVRGSTNEDQDPRRLRVLIDATAMPRRRGGVARYVDEIVRLSDASTTVVCTPRDAEHYRAVAPHVTVIAGPTALRFRGFRLMWEQLALPALAARIDANVVHSPHYTMPLVTRRPRVVTVHDVTFFTEPEVHTRVKAIFFRTWIRLSTRWASVIVAPSQATADELERATGYPASRVVIAPHGVDHERFRPSTPARVDATLRGLALDRPYILFLGTIEPRKNVAALIRAHSRLCEADAEAPTLVLAGAPGWDTTIPDALHAHHRPAAVRQLGFVSSDDLTPLLTGAEIVVYPSTGEGFGLPVLEAMATGAAVLTTPRLAIPEVAGDAAAYCEPTIDSITEALAQLLIDDDRRRELRARARKRAQLFSWSTSVAIHRAAYVSAAQAGTEHGRIGRVPAIS